MARTLDVYLYRNLVGTLTQNNEGKVSFQYADTWLNNSEAVGISQSLPLQREKYNSKACRAFFSGILPEEANRKIIARNLGISANNDFAMLEKIGGECAGAITFIRSGENLPDQNGQYQHLTLAELSEKLKILPNRPLMAGEDGVRLSLAGAQDKMAVCVLDGQFYNPLDGAPSTHIIKPANLHFAGVVFNEAFCMTLAKTIGLPAADVEVGSVEGIDYLLVERYDRFREKPHATDSPQSLERLHQEDFCQALNFAGVKYQNEGGPSIKHCFELVRQVSASPIMDIPTLLDGIIYNFLIGNCDAHGKNFSLLYHRTPDGHKARLAPFYDLICTMYYPGVSRHMAMKIGSEYAIDGVSSKDFEQLAEQIGVTKAQALRSLSKIAEVVLSKLPDINTNDSPVAGEISNIIQNRCKHVLNHF